MTESPTMRALILLALVGMTATPAVSQMAVIDNANLTQAREIATNTQAILRADQAIMQSTQKTLQAVTGDRSSLAQATSRRWRSAAASRWGRPRRSAP